MEIGIEGENTEKLFEASLRGCVSTLDMLLKRDPLILGRISLSSFTETPLHIASLLGHLDFTVALLDHKPDLSAVLNSQGQAPLHLASAEGYTMIVKALLRVKARVCLVPDQLGRIPLHLAAMRGRVEVIRELVDACPASVKVKLHGQETVLHLCIRYNHLQALQLLLTPVINESEFINSTDRNGHTILQLAISKKQIETIRYLVSIPEVRVKAEGLDELFANHQLAAENMQIQDSMVKTIFTKNRKDHNAVPPHDVIRNGEEPVQYWPVALSKYLDDQGKWLEKTRGNLMIVATVIATLAFQAAMNPPGGVWQAEAHYNDTDQSGCPVGVCKVGTSILSYNKDLRYYAFTVCNTISFSASLSTVILLLLSGYPLKRRLFVWLLLLAMCITLFFMAATYIISIMLVGAPEDFVIDRVVFFYVCFWGLLFSIVALYYVTSFLFWLLKKLIVGIFCGILYPFKLLLKLCKPRTRRPAGPVFRSTENSV
ncbi:hypothetical protein K2173_024574 [Erythroxylum novogranatense]|uniref:PGG domain-containing protein n=1 Tax=Erythroxylum novogranatense TaxID=1862640 RepID=A0AAV8SUZ1_9ROSI|nr:hypothetical protein K2173_024574 [Erythroxylum novogranatense]